MQNLRNDIVKLARRMAHIRTTTDRDSVIRAAEHIYNVAARNENELTQKIAKRRTHQRCPDRMEWVRQRHGWKILQEDAKLIVEIVHAQGRD